MNTFIIVLSLIAGVAGTGIGGIIGVLVADKGEKLTGRLIGFAGGVMLGVVMLEMLPEAVKNTLELPKGGLAVTISALVAGIAIIYLINLALNRLERPVPGQTAKQHRASMTAPGESAKTHYATTTMQYASLSGLTIKSYPTRVQSIANAKETGSSAKSPGINVKNRQLFKAGMIMLIAIALHNLPEGMAIGASGAYELSAGVLVSIVIAVHNIPEGMAIGAPLAGSGVKPLPTILLSALAGGATVLGAVIGLGVGQLGSVGTGVCLALASGAMLYVTFVGMLPEAVHLTSGKLPSVSILLGIIASAILVFSF